MTMIRQWLFMAVACMGLVPSLGAQSPEPKRSQARSLDEAVMTMQLSTSTVQVAEPFWLEFRCVAPAGTTVNFPAVIDRVGDLEVVDHEDQFDIPIESSLELRSWTRRLTLESIVTGSLTIPSIEVQLTHSSQAKRLATEPRQVNVLSVLEDRADPLSFRDIKPLADIEIQLNPSHGWIGWTIGGLVGVLLMVATSIALIRRQRFLTPVQWANRELDLLEQSFNGTATSDQVAFRWSSIMREFIQLQFGVSAPNQTTGELAETLRVQGCVDDPTANQIEALFALADQIKYAGVEMPVARLETAIQDGRRLVNHMAQDTPNGAEPGRQIRPNN